MFSLRNNYCPDRVALIRAVHFTPSQYIGNYRVSLPKEGSNAQILDLKQIMLIYNSRDGCQKMAYSVHSGRARPRISPAYTGHTAFQGSTLGLQDVTRDASWITRSRMYVGIKSQVYVLGHPIRSKVGDSGKFDCNLDDKNLPPRLSH